MKSNWHEAIQRYLEGRTSPEEAAALHEALNEHAELRALYLDYMNLDAALGAAAEAAVKREKPTAGTATSPRPPARLWANYWRWFGATAAFAALLVFAMLAWHRNSSWSRPDLAAAISSTKTAIARLSKEPPSSFPAWLSPTASLLDQPRIPQ